MACPPLPKTNYFSPVTRLQQESTSEVAYQGKISRKMIRGSRKQARDCDRLIRFSLVVYNFYNYQEANEEDFIKMVKNTPNSMCYVGVMLLTIRGSLILFLAGDLFLTLFWGGGGGFALSFSPKLQEKRCNNKTYSYCSFDNWLFKYNNDNLFT